jgi:hypothetical protein
MRHQGRVPVRSESGFFLAARLDLGPLLATVLQSDRVCPCLDSLRVYLTVLPHIYNLGPLVPLRVASALPAPLFKFRITFPPLPSSHSL